MNKLLFFFFKILNYYFIFIDYIYNVFILNLIHYLEKNKIIIFKNIINNLMHNIISLKYIMYILNILKLFNIKLIKLIFITNKYYKNIRFIINKIYIDITSSELTTSLISELNKDFRLL